MKDAGGLTRRDLLGVAAAAGLTLILRPGRSARAAALPVEELSLGEIRDGLRAGRYTTRALVDAYLARIESIDRRGPALRSVIEVNPDIVSIADRADNERRAGKARGALHGVPILIKDNIDTADRMMSTAGSLALVGPRAPRDAFVVERLRAAGAVLLGKTNLSEWANIRSTRSSSGWSARGGQTKNPHVLSRSPSGSSSGSGAAVAAGLCAAAVGTETDGSIVSPASCCGIVGIKPTVGLVGRSGIVPIAHSQDTAGPMARSVADAAILLGAMTGLDPRDDASKASRGRAPADYTRFLDANGLRGARLGVCRSAAFKLGPECARVLDAAVAALKDRGAVVIDNVDIDNADKLEAPEMEILLYELKDNLARYLAARPDLPVKTLADVIAYNEKNRDKEMPFFGQELFLDAEKKGPLTSAPYQDALAQAREYSREKGIDALIRREKLDAIVAVTNGAAWPIDLIGGDHYTGGSSTPAAVAGYPAITVPAGHAFALPVGLSFFGPAWSEPALIKYAYAFEQATRARRTPAFRAEPDYPSHAIAP